MYSISNIKDPDYLVKHSYQAYLSEQDSEKGRFLGRGALLNKRHGKEVDKEGFYSLIDYKPGVKSKNYGTELVFSAPKDWSILINLVDDPTREKMQNAWNNMVNHSVKTIEENTFYRKKSKGKVTYELAKAVEFAVFNHHTARTIEDRPDMQEHVHITISPKVMGQDGKYYSHTLKDLVKEKSGDDKKKQATLHYFDQTSQAFLAKFLQKELGLNVTRGINDSFQIEGITKEQREFFSKRSEQAKKELKEKGHKGTAKQRQKAITQKRNKKQDYDLKDLREVWREEFKTLRMHTKNLSRGQKEQAKNFQEAFKDIKFIDTKQLNVYALTESKFSNKSAAQLFEEYRNDSMLKEFAPGKYINTNHKGAKDFEYNYAKGKLQALSGSTPQKTSTKSQGKQTAEARLRELEAEHQAKIAELSSSRNSLSKLSQEQSSFEERKNALIQEISREAEKDIDYDDF